MAYPLSSRLRPEANGAMIPLRGLCPGRALTRNTLMAGNSNPGSHGGLTNNAVVDNGTMCVQASPPPGVIFGAPRTLLDLNIPGPILVGKARRDPGFNFDGSPAEDMMAGDKPAKSAAIRSDPMFNKSDDELNAYMRSLMTSTSIGDMETVALEMQKRFADATGGTYHSAILDAEIANNPAFVTYHGAFLKKLIPAITNSVRGYSPSSLPPSMASLVNPLNITPLTMSLLNFSSFWDKISGLGITVHQVWSAKAELKDFHVESSGRFWLCWLHYTFYDHFGLDWEDILKHGDDRLPKYHTGDQFKAWYILQHYRTAKPFITEMSRKVYISGRIA
ncbi:MAG TPA: DUF3289 family protein [Chromatiaceae bacterium]|nr:DUF3289 family protein [Chromatiaceae bacterium]